MKTTLRYLTTLTLFFIAAITANAQITVTSTQGYTVDINVQPESIIAPNSCQWGYTYKVRLSYIINFIGSNAPKQLYTLQGTVGCGSNQQFFDLPNKPGVGVANSANAWTSASSCQTATPSELNCNAINIQIEGPGIPSQTISYPVTFGTLPVKMVSFDATTIGNSVKLDWTTATETNNEGFTIQRSTNGTDWVDIAMVKGAGNSNDRRDYSAFDNNPVIGSSLYRLKQKDINGKLSFTETVSVKFEQNTKASIAVFPVPNSGRSITVNGISNISQYQMQVLDQNGLLKHQNSNLTQAKIELPVLKAGVYMIRFTNRDTQEQTTVRYVQL